MARLWACARCLVFLVLLVGVTVAFFWAAQHNAFIMRSLSAAHEEGGLTPWAILPSEVLQLAAVCVVSWVVICGQHYAQKKKGGWQSFLEALSLLDTHWVRKLLLGACWGGVWAAGVIAVIALCGSYHFLYTAPSLYAAIVHLAFYSVAFLVVGMTEELMFRGYLYTQLRNYLGFRWAALITSFLFGLIHMPSGTPLLGVMGVGVIGYIFCLMIRSTGSLFFPIGFHAAWDWMQTAFFGVNDSGHSAHEALFHAVPHGPHWLTGGSDGPEASAVCFVAYAMLIFLCHRKCNESCMTRNNTEAL